MSFVAEKQTKWFCYVTLHKVCYPRFVNLFSVYVTLVYVLLCHVMLYCVTLTSRYLFSRNLLRLDAFHYTNSFNHKLYTWRGTLKSSNLLPRQRQNPHYWFSQPKSSLRLFGLSHTSTTSVLFKDLRLARAASCEKKEKMKF